MKRMKQVQRLLLAAGLTIAACGGEAPTRGEDGKQLQSYSSQQKKKISCDRIKTRKKCLATNFCAWEANPLCNLIEIYPPQPCEKFCYDPTIIDDDNNCSVVNSTGVIIVGECPSGSGQGNSEQGGPEIPGDPDENQPGTAEDGSLDYGDNCNSEKMNNCQPGEPDNSQPEEPDNTQSGDSGNSQSGEPDDNL